MRRLLLAFGCALALCAGSLSAQERVICVSGCAGGTQGAGTVDSTTTRVTIATDDEVNNSIADAVTSLQTIDNAVSGSGINISQVDGAAPAATNPLPVRLSDGSAFVALATDQTLDSGIGTQGPLLVGRGSTATPTAMSADNDATAVWLDLSGRVHVSTEGVEDVAETAGAFLNRMGAVRRDVAASSTATDAENATVNTDALGLLWSRQLDPCSGVAKTYLPIDIVTATTTEITPSLAGSSMHYYICALNLVTAGANNVAVVDDNTDGCGSVTAGIFGGFGSAAEGWNFAANGGIALGNGNSSVGRTTTSNAVICIITSAAVQLSGMMVVVAAP